MQVEQVEPKLSSGGYGQVSRNVKVFQIGSGENTFKITEDGVSIGGENYATARTSQGFDGSIRHRDSDGNVVIETDPNG